MNSTIASKKGVMIFMIQLSRITQQQKQRHARNHNPMAIKVSLHTGTHPGNGYPDSEVKLACWSTIKKESG